MNQSILTGFTDPSPHEYEAKHRALARQAAAEGIVLLKNEHHVLPLSPNARVALYGAGAVNIIKGGTGSGDVNVRDTVSLCEGLRNTSFQIVNENFLQRCEHIYDSARKKWKDCIWEKLESGAEPHFFASYVNTPFTSPQFPEPEFFDCDAVLYVISRTAGEGADRRMDAGDYALSSFEIRDLERLCALYPSVILVLNVGGMIDLSILDRLPQIHGVLLLSQPGMEGGNAIADVISGQVSPCGKLTDTWPLHPQDHPCLQAQSQAETAAGEPRYRENIYVGYRYFDTFEVPVRYSFGYGQSYTSFSIEARRISADASGITVSVAVKNTGTVYSGKQVVQIYATCPLNGLHKEFRRLVCYEKTKLLRPGEVQSLTLQFPIDRLTSYAPAVSGTVLCAGTYPLWIGSSLSDAQLVGAITRTATSILQKTERLWPEFDNIDELIPDLKRGAERRNELDHLLALNALPIISADVCTPLKKSAQQGSALAEAALQTASSLTNAQLIRLCVGQWSRETESQLGAAGVSVPGSAGETSSAACDEGVRSMVLADGPAGLRLNKFYYEVDGIPQIAPLEQCFEGGYLARSEYVLDGNRRYQYCTAFPIGTMLAQTWNPELLQQVGDAVGSEMELFNISLWLAPGMNIHRAPLCGRNFEYFSEDPLVSGLAAAAITMGVQSHPGCGVTLKHFACNNQEELRLDSDSLVSERALREIYLKGFEIAVTSAKPLAIMTAYNLVNHIHAANSSALCTHIARDEWGFDGLIMTDWDTTSSHNCTPEGCILAGNDLMMPGSIRECQALDNALLLGTITREDLVRCAAHIIRVALAKREQ